MTACPSTCPPKCPPKCPPERPPECPPECPPTAWHLSRLSFLFNIVSRFISASVFFFDCLCISIDRVIFPCSISMLLSCQIFEDPCVLLFTLLNTCEPLRKYALFPAELRIMKSRWWSLSSRLRSTWKLFYVFHFFHIMCVHVSTLHYCEVDIPFVTIVLRLKVRIMTFLRRG